MNNLNPKEEQILNLLLEDRAFRRQYVFAVNTNDSEYLNILYKRIRRMAI